MRQDGVNGPTRANGSTYVNRHNTSVVSRLLFGRLFTIPSTIRSFARYSKYSNVLTGRARTFLIFHEHQIFRPRRTVVFGTFAGTHHFGEHWTVIRIVRRVFVGAGLIACHIGRFQRRVRMFLHQPRLLFQPLSFNYKFVDRAFAFQRTMNNFRAESSTLRTSNFRSRLLVANVVVRDFVGAIANNVTVGRRPFAEHTTRWLMGQRINDFNFGVPRHRVGH